MSDTPDKYADKLLIGLSEEENKQVLDEFDEIDRQIDLINEIDNIDDIEIFRKVVYKENQDIISSSYDVKSGEYILVPSER